MCATSMKKRLSQLFKRAVNRYTKFSLLSAVFLSVLCYFVNNLPIFTGENLNQQFITQYFCEKIGFAERMNLDSVTFYNVSNDKQVIYSYDADGVAIKTTAITDRKKLAHFLHLLKESGSYKYIILDLLFCKGDSTEYDDELFSLIAGMDRIVFADSDSLEVAEPILEDKAAIAEYYSTITATNFTRYEYLRGDKRYLPLRVYEDLHPKEKIKRFGWRWLSLYFSDYRLCRNTVFLTFDTESFQKFVYIDSDKAANRYYDIGKDILLNINNSKATMNEEAMIQKLATLNDNKYVIIGNLTEDVHDTYAGKKPGSLILLRAIQALEDGKNIVKPLHTFFWFLVYFLISLFICSKRTVLQYIPVLNRAKHKITHYFVDVASFGLILLLLSIAEYVLFHTVYSLAAPWWYFTILKLILDYKSYKI